MTAEQQYCLRWNNHQRNLLLAFDDLLRKEEFTDVTLACDYGDAIKCHRMVLAACSPYFQQVFTDLPCHHPVVVLKDVKLGEMKAMLEYMYKGEVSIAQEGLAALLRMAEALCVKGLVEENRIRPPAPVKEEEPPEDHSPSVSTSNPVTQTTVHSSCHSSPPHSTNSHYKTHYNPYKTQEPRMNLPIWPVPGLPVPTHPAPITSNHPNPIISGCYDAGADMSPLRRKKISSMMMNRDTPILRTVLGHGQPDSSQPVSLVCHSDNADHSNGSEDRMKHMKNEPSEDAQSPYTDFSPANDVEEKSRLAIPSTSPPQSFTQDMRGVSSGIATYVPAQKPEWKRYKQYTRNDILSAIEAVRNGMSALQAARKYGVPSRTLYDKVKKLGITTSRPFKRGSNGGAGCFPYGAGSPYESDDGPNNNNSSSLMEASTFLQHALENRGDEREALAAMAAAAAAHAVASGHSTSPNGRARSPSPSPTMIKYMRHFGMTPSPAPGSHSTNGSSERDHEDEQDQVEDLSVKRKEPTRVIMPPMNQVSAIRKKEEMLIDSIKEEARREVSMKCEAE